VSAFYVRARRTNVSFIYFGGFWALILFAFPISTALIALLFNRAKKTGSMPF
jgi:hypothetical protein